MAKSDDLLKSLAMMSTIVKSKDVKIHCEARLGVSAVPDLAEFNSQDAATVDRCMRFLDFLHENINVLWAELNGRERQKEIDFTWDGADKPKGKAKAKTKAVKKRGKKKAKGKKS